MKNAKRPYLVIPFLMPQPTWGGSYISRYKSWQDLPELEGLKIGQSYELYGKSVLTDCPDTSAPAFRPIINGINNSLPEKSFSLTDLTDSEQAAFFGPEVAEKYGKMPILIKFTQALGNSFQIHKKPSDPDPSWQPKAESWYFLEKGKLTYGVRFGVSLNDYKNACLVIEAYMKKLSAEVVAGQLTVKKAEEKAREFIRKTDPWQFVNLHEVNRGTLVDLSGGGLHHSWEEDPGLVSGNIVYEVQQDVADDASTLRSFDQGKIKPDGSVRPIQVESYFRHLDPDPVRNNLQTALRHASGPTLLHTPYYSMDELTVSGKRLVRLSRSFHHLFVLIGTVEIHTAKSVLIIRQGHSGFIPYDLQEYEIVAKSAKILKTYI